MPKELSLKVGGIQGEGIELAGDMLSTVLNRQGYYINTYRTFSSRIKGGNANSKIRATTEPAYTVSDQLHVLIAFNQDAINLNHKELEKDGLIIADAGFAPVAPESCTARIVEIPFKDIAKDVGDTLMKNIVAVGASACLMGLETDFFAELIKERFAKKSEDIVTSNIKALEAGRAFVLQNFPDATLKLEPPSPGNRLLMTGNNAAALGCLAGGVRFLASYPISPATDILENLVKYLPKVGGAAVQTEDEISAVMMAIGANFAGVRSLTSTSGPGFSLMAEALGLAGMTETPLVVIDVQRGGPSTGLPTKTETSDLMAAIHSAHGESPRIVLAPSTVEEAFYDSALVFNLAEEYQCPVILLLDMQLGLGSQTVEAFDLSKVEINRGALVSEAIEAGDPGQYFKRYGLTETGVSPRVLPGMENGIHHVTGVEHDETGKPSELTSNRANQMEKRMRKLEHVKIDVPVVIDAPHENPDALFIGFNSTRGAIHEAISKLAAEGVKANHAHIRLLHPFPTDEIAPLVNNAKTVIVVENNITAQLSQIIKQNVNTHGKVQNVLKYNGEPFFPDELYNKCKELI